MIDKNLFCNNNKVCEYLETYCFNFTKKCLFRMNVKKDLKKRKIIHKIL